MVKNGRRIYGLTVLSRIKRQLVRVGNCRYCLDIGHIQLGIADTFGVYCLGLWRYRFSGCPASPESTRFTVMPNFFKRIPERLNVPP